MVRFHPPEDASLAPHPFGIEAVMASIELSNFAPSAHKTITHCPHFGSSAALGFACRRAKNNASSVAFGAS
jgi:hypothetical protein